MTDQSDAKDIPVWDGNRDKLPEMWRLFFYKDKKYLPVKLHNHLFILDVEKEKFSISVEIRMVGAKSDFAVANTLIKAGMATIEEVADAYENKDGRLGKLILKFGDLLKKQSNKETCKFLKSKGITDQEFHKMCNVLAQAAIGTMIVDIFSS